MRFFQATFRCSTYKYVDRLTHSIQPCKQIQTNRVCVMCFNVSTKVTRVRVSLHACSFLYLEEEAAALVDTAEEEPEPSPEKVQEDEESASSDDGWGVSKKETAQNTNQKTKRAKQEKAQSRTGPVATPALSENAEPERPAKVTTQVPKNVDKMVAQANTLVTSLKQMNPVLIWQNSSKQKECETKLKKAEPYLAALESSEKTEAVAKVYHELKVVYHDWGIWYDLVLPMRDSTIEQTEDANNFTNYIAEHGATVVKYLGKQTSECVKIVLCEFGRLFCEAGRVQTRSGTWCSSLTLTLLK